MQDVDLKEIEINGTKYIKFIQGSLMDILSFLYRMDIVGFMKIINILLGLALCFFVTIIPRKVLSKIMCGYIAIIMGSILGFIIAPAWIAMALGIIVIFGIFYFVEKFFNHSAIFTMTFVFVIDIIYIIGTIICSIVMDIGNDMELSSKEEIRFYSWFDIEGYPATDRLFLIATCIAVIIGIGLSKVNKEKVYVFMCCVVGTIQLFGFVFSEPSILMGVQEECNIERWEQIFIPMMNIEFYELALYLFVPILLLALVCYLIQTKIIARKLR